MATAGPGVTNTVTAMANASSLAPVLVIGGCTSRAAGQHGAAPGYPACRYPAPRDAAPRTLRVADQVIRELDEAVARAMGDAGEPGPSISKSPPTCCARTSPKLVLDEWMAAKHGGSPSRPRGDRAGSRRVLVGEAPARGHRAAGASAAPSSCACSMPPARSISTPRRAAACARPIIQPRSAGARGGDDRRRRRLRDRPQLDTSRLRLAGGVPAGASSASPTIPASSSTIVAASRSFSRRPISRSRRWSTRRATGSLGRQGLGRGDAPQHIATAAPSGRESTTGRTAAASARDLSTRSPMSRLTTSRSPTAATSCFAHQA